MPRRAVEFRAGEFYHVYNRGNDRRRIFLERENYLFFLRKLREHVATPAADVLAYCLMPNHYHLLVRLRTDAFSACMQTFTLSYVKSVNQGYGRAGSLFQGRFRAVHVDRDDYLLHLSRYIHLNPVKAHLVRRPENWEFSSYREYAGLRNGTLPQTTLLIREFDSSERYRAFVESGISKDDSLIAHLTIDGE